MPPKKNQRKDLFGNPLLPNMHYKHSAYYFVDKSRAWHRLSKKYPDALRKMADFSLSGSQLNTMNALFDWYKKEIIGDSQKTWDQFKLGALKRLSAYCGHMKPHEMKPHHATKYMRASRSKKRANHDYQTLRHVFSSAIAEGEVDFIVNPVVGARANKTKSRDRVVSQDEYLLVYEMASAKYQVAMELARITGLRQGDILGLQWGQVDDAGIYNTANKNNRKIAFVMNWSLKMTLDEARKLSGKVLSWYVVPAQKGQGFTSSGFASGWQKLMKQAIEKHGIEKFTFHDIRSMAADMKSSDKEAADLLGNTEAMTRKIYRRKGMKVEPNV